MIDDIALFVAVVTTGSLKSASKVLNIPASTVSRRIKALEHQLGCLLLNRNSHTFSLTNEGQLLFDRADFHIKSCQSIVRSIQNDVSGMQGGIKILAPTNLVMTVLQPILSRYLDKHPDIELELELSNQLIPFSVSGADFAIRVGPQVDSELTQVKLGAINTVLVASPQYLEKLNIAITQPLVLQDIDLIVAKPLIRWKLFHCHNLAMHCEILPQKKRIIVNDLKVAAAFATDGFGVALLPEMEIKPLLLNGKLQCVLPEWRGEVREVFAVWYRRQLLTRRANALIDYLKTHHAIAGFPSISGD